MLFKISVLKSFAILEPFSNNKVADLLLQNTYGNCFWIFVAANSFCSWIWNLLLTIAPVFVLDSFENSRLNLRSSHWSCSVERAFICKFHKKTTVLKSLFYSIADLSQMFSCETYEIFKNTYFEICERLLLKPALSLGLFFLIIYVFVWQFSLHSYWYCYIQKQSSGGALRKRCSNKFRKFHKAPALKTRF